MARARGPMPRVEYNGKSYALLSRETPIPNFEKMELFAILVWLNRSTRACGRSTSNDPLVGMAGAITVGTE